MRILPRTFGGTVTALALMLVLPGKSSAQTIGEVAAEVSGSVFHVVGELGDGSGFLVDRSRGLVMTNAHVTSGLSEVGVKLSQSYKVRGVVLHENHRADVAIVQVNPDAVEGRREISVEPEAYERATVGDRVIVMGFPFRTGAVATTGIISQKGNDVLLTDADVNPGNSGGPLFISDGSAIGLTTFRAGGGSGLGGAIPARVIQQHIALATDRLRESTRSPPSSDSLPTLPSEPFPLEVLEEAALADEWPTDLYNLSSETRTYGYEVKVITPPLQVREQGRMADLRYWSQGLGGYPPVVILRVRPDVGQSRTAFWFNVLGGAASDAVGASFTPMYDPVALGTLERVVIQQHGGGFIDPIRIRRATANEQGQAVQVMHLLLPAHAFAPNDDGEWEGFIIQVHDADRGLLVWNLPPETMRQVYRDFSVYLAGP